MRRSHVGPIYRLPEGRKISHRMKEGQSDSLKKGGQTGQFSVCLLSYLLDGKLFERIIETRVVQHLAQSDPELNDDQYEF